MSTEKILIFCAHNDDQIIGCGGTFIKYAREGKELYTYIFTYGEKSHPHYNEDEIRKTRIDESIKSDKIMEGKGIAYFGLPEGKIKDSFEKQKLKKTIIQIIKEKNPTKIFTHAVDDPHPDHKAVRKIMLNIIDEMKYKGEVYTFDVWNPLSFRERNEPKLVVDITDTFATKIKAFKCHKSQKIVILQLLPVIYARALISGLQTGYTYAEVFTKIR